MQYLGPDLMNELRSVLEIAETGALSDAVICQHDLFKQ